MIRLVRTCFGEDRRNGQPGQSLFEHHVVNQPYSSDSPLHSGLTGEEMPCDIFIGLVYYQRLRHMVSDKFQVRALNCEGERK
jgi:DNA-directed RNA polymerase beta subunit